MAQLEFHSTYGKRDPETGTYSVIPVDEPDWEGDDNNDSRIDSDKKSKPGHGKGDHNKQRPGRTQGKN